MNSQLVFDLSPTRNQIVIEGVVPFVVPPETKSHGKTKSKNDNLCDRRRNRIGGLGKYQSADGRQRQESQELVSCVVKIAPLCTNLGVQHSQAGLSCSLVELLFKDLVVGTEGVVPQSFIQFRHDNLPFGNLGVDPSANAELLEGPV